MGRSRRRGRRRGRSNRMFLEDVASFSMPVGTFQNLTKSNFTALPNRFNFRPVYLEFQMVGGYTPAHLSENKQFINPGYWSPASFQFWFAEGGAQRSTTSPVFELSERPIKRRIYYPKSGDWYSSEAPGNTTIAGFEAICPGKPSSLGDVAYVRGHIRMRFQLSQEVYPAECPTGVEIFDAILRPSTSSSSSFILADDYRPSAPPSTALIAECNRCSQCGRPPSPAEEA